MSIEDLIVPLGKPWKMRRTWRRMKMIEKEKEAVVEEEEERKRRTGRRGR